MNSPSTPMAELDLLLDSIPAHVTVLAVSKLQPVEKIRALYERRGHLDFGENYVQEALAKQISLAELPVRWHLIGSLQTNKVKSVVGKFELLHGVDSLRLAEKISREAVQKSVTQKILLQINIAHEVSKGGFELEKFELHLERILELPSLDVCGVMTMPPLGISPNDNRKHFSNLKRISDQLIQLRPSATEISMGTTSDFRDALAEGATIIRLGSLIFGERLNA